MARFDWKSIGIGVAICAVLILGGMAFTGTGPFAQRVARVQKETPGQITATIDDNTFNFSAAIDANGSVANKAVETANITVENTGQKTMKELLLTIKEQVRNTVTEGLPDDFENSYVQVDVVAGGTTIPLYKDAEYKKQYDAYFGTNVGNPNLVPGATTTVQVKITLKEAPDGTFTDGQNYDGKVWLVEPLTGTYDFTQDTIDINIVS